MIILIKLLIAHILGDFLLQPKSWIEHKRKHTLKSGYLVLHSLIHGLLSYILLWDLSRWHIAIWVLTTHYFIDLLKVYQKDNLIYFILDQVLHLLVIVSLTWQYFIFPKDIYLSELINFLNSQRVWITILSYLLISYPCSYILAYILKRWTPGTATSLTNAGQLIGLLERVLALTFILTNHFEGVGFLIAAKSILRFTELKNSNRKESEYVLIGTLLSFTYVILIGILTSHLLEYYDPIISKHQ